MRPSAFRSAFRVGAFGALGGVIAEIVNGHATDTKGLALFAIEVWAIAGLLWLVLALIRPAR
jgi:hypothetical protein